MAVLSVFSKICQNIFYLAIFFNFSNIWYLFWSMRVMLYIYCKYKKEMVDWGYTNLFFMKNNLLKMLLYDFWYVNFFKINITLVKKYMTKPSFSRFSGFFQRSIISEKFAIWQHFPIKCVQPFEYLSKFPRFLYLAFVNWKNIVYLIFLICIIYAFD